jgi:hypothetical protein
VSARSRAQSWFGTKGERHAQAVAETEALEARRLTVEFDLVPAERINGRWERERRPTNADPAIISFAYFS